MFSFKEQFTYLIQNRFAKSRINLSTSRPILFFSDFNMLKINLNHLIITRK